MSTTRLMSHHHILSQEAKATRTGCERMFSTGCSRLLNMYAPLKSFYKAEQTKSMLESVLQIIEDEHLTDQDFVPYILEEEKLNSVRLLVHSEFDRTDLGQFLNAHGFFPEDPDSLGLNLKLHHCAAFALSAYDDLSEEHRSKLQYIVDKYSCCKLELF